MIVKLVGLKCAGISAAAVGNPVVRFGGIGRHVRGCYDDLRAVRT